MRLPLLPLSAALLALVTAVPPPLAYATVILRTAGADPPPAFPAVARAAIRAHLAMAKPVITYFADHYFARLNPDDLPACDDDHEQQLDLAAPTLHDDDDDDAADAAGRALLEDVIISQNLELDSNGDRIIICRDEEELTKALLSFYFTIYVFVCPDTERHRLPKEPDLNAIALLDDGLWLRSEADNLVAALLDKFDEDEYERRFSWDYWKDRVKFLDLAISHIQIFAKGPFQAHGVVVKALIDRRWHSSRTHDPDLLDATIRHLERLETDVRDLYGASDEDELNLVLSL